MWTFKLELQRVPGQVTHFRKYLAHFSEKTTLLRELLKLDRDFNWGPAHTKDLDGINAALTSSLVLAVYDPSKETKESTDALKFGLGAAKVWPWVTTSGV